MLLLCIRKVGSISHFLRPVTQNLRSDFHRALNFGSPVVENHRSDLQFRATLYVYMYKHIYFGSECELLFLLYSFKKKCRSNLCTNRLGRCRPFFRSCRLECILCALCAQKYHWNLRIKARVLKAYQTTQILLVFLDEFKEKIDTD